MDAFVACGGNPDKSGHVERAVLVRIVKVDFGLMIDIDELIDAIDTDGSGEIEYSEFKVREEDGGAQTQGGYGAAAPHGALLSPRTARVSAGAAHEL